MSNSRARDGRARVSRRSYAVLKRLHALPRWVVPAATVALVFIGLYAGPLLGAACLLVLAAFLGWLAYLGWPSMTGGGRVMRVLVAALVVAAAMARLLGAEA